MGGNLRKCFYGHQCSTSLKIYIYILNLFFYLNVKLRFFLKKLMKFCIHILINPFPLMLFQFGDIRDHCPFFPFVCSIELPFSSYCLYLLPTLLVKYWYLWFRSNKIYIYLNITVTVHKIRAGYFISLLK